MRELTEECFQKKTEGRRPRIQDVLTKGQELIVQVEKDERDTKGASLTTYISIPGRYIVMMPGSSVSAYRERSKTGRQGEAEGDIQQPEASQGHGFILRTAGSDKTSDDLSNT